MVLPTLTFGTRLPGSSRINSRRRSRGGIWNALTRNWSLDSVFNMRSAGPVNVVYGVPTSFGLLYLRPDVISGAPPYLNDATVAGGRRINPEAFIVPQDLGRAHSDVLHCAASRWRRSISAFRRRFNFSENVRLIVGAEASNVFNHPNFAAPAGNDASLGTRFGPSASPMRIQLSGSRTQTPREAPGVSPAAASAPAIILAARGRSSYR